MRQSPTIEFGELLKQHRKAQGWSQIELARRAGFSPSYISKLERDDRPPPQATAHSLGTVLELAPAQQVEFLEAARRACARHLESRGLKETARLLGRLPTLRRRTRPLVGRDEEIRSIISRLADPGVIINITGDPAIGKTTVALEVAHDYLDQGRVVLWGDAREGTANSVAEVQSLLWHSTVGGQMPDSELQRQKRLSAAISRHSPLIVLDNLESAEEFIGILEFANQVGQAASVLIASRRWIPVRFGDNVPLLELHADEGVQLFEEVGQAYVKHAIVEKDRRIIELICTDFLEGHPGAIEIAASLWKAWPLEAILRGLKQRAMEILEDPHSSDINRSMRLSIGLSYDLLQEENEEAWEVFPRLSVFQASFSYQTAEVVAKVPQALPALEFLVDRSLVRFDGARHRLHSVVREFALEKLGQARGEYELRAAEYFLDFVKQHKSDFDRLDEEKGNLFATMDWAEAHQEYRSIAIDLADSLHIFMDQRGLWAERLRRVQRALEIAELIGDKVSTVKLCYDLGDAFQDLEKYEDARTYLEKGLALAQRMGDPEHIGTGLIYLAYLALEVGDYHEAGDFCLKAYECLEPGGTTEALPLIAQIVGLCSEAIGDSDLAYSYLETGLTLAERLEDVSTTSMLLDSLCRLDIKTGNFENAEERIQEYERLAQQTGDLLAKATTLLIRGELMLKRSRQRKAVSYFMAASSHFEQLGRPMEAAYSRERLILVANQLKDYSLVEEQLKAITSTFVDLGNDEMAANAFFKLGLVQENFGRPEDAGYPTRIPSHSTALSECSRILRQRK